MRSVKFNPPDSLDEPQKRWWQDWSKRAEKATEAVINDAKAGREIDFDKNKTVWSDLKNWLLTNVFDGKCAYCESKVTVTDFGAADHYRPKGAVTTRVDGEVQPVLVSGRKHPGYYWLAYDWRNLLPACDKCNTIGKASQFPVNRTYACSPDEGRDCDVLDAIEEPLLLNPYKDDPSKYIIFGAKGEVTPIGNNPKGANSIRVYLLERERLKQSRERAQRAAWREFLQAVGDNVTRAREVFEDIKKGKEPHSTASMDYIKFKWAEQQSVLA